MFLIDIIYYILINIVRINHNVTKIIMIINIYKNYIAVYVFNNVIAIIINIKVNIYVQKNVNIHILINKINNVNNLVI